jgi:hypothetical protein
MPLPAAPSLTLHYVDCLPAGRQRLPVIEWRLRHAALLAATQKSDPVCVEEGMAVRNSKTPQTHNGIY